MSTINKRSEREMLMDRLKKIRKDKKMTQTMLAKLCGISRNSIVNWETGKSTPKIGDIEKLSAALGISPRMLMEGSVSVQGQETLLPEQQEPKGFEYWSGVVSEARLAAVRGDEAEMQLIEPLLKMAHEVLSLGMKGLKHSRSKSRTPSVSAYNGDHSSYTGNTLMVEPA